MGTGAPARGVLAVLAALLALSSLAVCGDMFVRKGKYPPAWRNYFAAGEWIRESTYPDAVVACRKGFLMYLVSERKTVGYAWAEPEAVVAGLERDGADLVVVDWLPYASTARYLVPAVNAFRSRFRVVHTVPDPDTYVLLFERQAPE